MPEEAENKKEVGEEGNKRRRRSRETRMRRRRRRRKREEEACASLVASAPSPHSTPTSHSALAASAIVPHGAFAMRLTAGHYGLFAFALARAGFGFSDLGSFARP